jgi:glycosyltransferase 2 family protein
MMKWLLTLVLLCGAVYLLDWQELRNTLSRISAGAFVFAVVLLLPENLVLAIRWHLIVRTHVPLPMLAHVRYYFISVFLNMFTPAQVGGDIYRFLSLKSATASGWTLAGTILRERLIGVAGYALFFLICFAIFIGINGSGSLPEIYWLGSAAFILGFLALTLVKPVLRLLRRFRYPFLGRPLARLDEVLSTALNMGSLQFIAGIQSLSLLTCATWTFSILIIARDFNLQTDFLVLGMVGILTDLIRALPITIQGIGVREGVFAFLLSTTGVTLEEGFAVGLAAYLAVTVAIILVGAVGFSMPKPAIDQEQV